MSQQLVEEFNLRKFFLEEHKNLTVKDIESDINWLYRKTKREKPIIIILKSIRKMRKFLKEETRWEYTNRDEQFRFGLAHELDFFTTCKMNLRENFSDDINRYVDFLSKGVWEFIPTTN